MARSLFRNSWRGNYFSSWTFDGEAVKKTVARILEECGDVNDLSIMQVAWHCSFCEVDDAEYRLSTPTSLVLQLRPMLPGGNFATTVAALASSTFLLLADWQACLAPLLTLSSAGANDH